MTMMTRFLQIKAPSIVHSFIHSVAAYTPAWVSPREFVIMSKVVKMLGVTVT